MRASEKQKKEDFPTHSDASTSLIETKGSTRKKKKQKHYRPIPLMNMDIEVLNKIKVSNIYKEFYTTSEIYPRNATRIQHTIKYGQCNISY